MKKELSLIVITLMLIITAGCSKNNIIANTNAPIANINTGIESNVNINANVSNTNTSTQTNINANINASVTNINIGNKNNNINQASAANFNVIFRYGVGAKNELNTIDQTFTKDIITSPSKTVPFQLTADELNSIQQKIIDDELFDTSKTSTNSTGIMVTPCQSYYLQIIDKGVKVEKNWDDCEGLMTEQQKDFSAFIITLIESNPEYQKLPPATGGYL